MPAVRVKPAVTTIDPTELEALRTYVVRLAYRMLGSAADAEDVAQEAFVRWSRADDCDTVRMPRAWLTRTATRLCLDRIRATQRAREEYVGPNLPEPYLEASPDPLELDESLSLALLATIQRLRPAERAVFLLHDVFGHPFEEVADALDLRADHCRQLAVRAREHLQVERIRSDATPEVVHQLTEAFFAAIEEGATDRLRTVLAEGVVLRADGGGKVPAVPVPLEGVEAVTRFLDRVLAKPRPSPVQHRRRVWFNGAPGVVVTDAAGAPQTAFWFSVHAGRIQAIYAQRNPDKLAALRG